MSAVVGSAVLFNDFSSNSPDEVLLFLIGCFITFFGVYLTTSKAKKLVARISRPASTLFTDAIIHDMMHRRGSADIKSAQTTSFYSPPPEHCEVLTPTSSNHIILQIDPPPPHNHSSIFDRSPVKTISEMIEETNAKVHGKVFGRSVSEAHENAGDVEESSVDDNDRTQFLTEDQNSNSTSSFSTSNLAASDNFIATLNSSIGIGNDASPPSPAKRKTILNFFSRKLSRNK